MQQEKPKPKEGGGWGVSIKHGIFSMSSLLCCKLPAGTVVKIILTYIIC